MYEKEEGQTSFDTGLRLHVLVAELNASMMRGPSENITIIIVQEVEV